MTSRLRPSFYCLITLLKRSMAVGKNKGLKIGGKKGAKKKVVDPFTRKDWYDIKAPSLFKVRQVGKTLVNRTAGTRIASDGLKGRVYEVSLADLQNENDAERSFRKFKLVCEEVQGENCLRPGWAGEKYPQEDDRHHQPRGDHHRPEGRRQQADGYARRGQRQSRCDHRRCHRRSCGATRGIRASSAGVCLDFVPIA